MTRNYYTGVPIGGTILWGGGLVGLPIPDNFTENYQLGSYSDSRKSNDFTATALPCTEGYNMSGGTSDNYITPVELDGVNEFALELDNLPIIEKTMTGSEFPTFKWSKSNVEGLVTISELSSGSLATSYSSQGDRYHPRKSSAWNWDNGNSLNGSGRDYFYTTASSSKTSSNQTSSHDHANVEKNHNHTIDLPLSIYTYSATTNRFNTGSQEDISYEIVSPSRGIQFITRMY